MVLFPEFQVPSYQGKHAYFLVRANKFESYCVYI